MVKAVNATKGFHSTMTMREKNKKPSAIIKKRKIGVAPPPPEDEEPGVLDGKN